MAQKIEKPLNIILLIGDGMGLAQISAAAFMNGGLALELFKNIVPKTVENFINLITGDKKTNLHYKNSLFFRLIPDFII